MPERLLRILYLLALIASPALGYAEVQKPFAASNAAAARVTNYTPGEVIRYPVALLVGELSDAKATQVTLTNASSKRPTATMKGQALGRKFKVLAELVPGENKLTIAPGSAGEGVTAAAPLAITLNYKPQTNPHFVRMIYMTDSTGETAYQSQRENDAQDFDAKLDTAMKLMQTLTAERMHDLGYGRQTFNMELDEAGKVKVHVHKGAKPAADYYKLDDQAWYREVAKEVNAAFDMKHAKNIVIAAYTRWDPATKRASGHTALGGGNQGLFGSGNLFTWPSSLADVQGVFMDATRMDTTKTQDDSGGRGMVWSAAATTIGATLHEMGHAFGLPHTRVSTDVMSRGFDQFNRVFTLSEPTRRNNNPRLFKPEEATAFAPPSAESLLTSRWFALDAREFAQKNDISINYDAADDSIVIKSPTGVGFFAADSKGDAVFHRSPPRDKAAPAEFRVPVADIRKVIPEGDAMFRAANADGHVGRSSLERLVKRAAEQKDAGPKADAKQPDKKADDGFVDLIGKDLTGWCYKDKDGKEEVFDGKTESSDKRYTAKDDMIVVNGRGAGPALRQLWTTAKFGKDFELRVEFRAAVNADSGLFVRGPQLQVRDYLVAGPYKNLKSYKPQDWNQIVVIVKDNVAHCTCNGEVLEAALRLPETGPIGLEADRNQMEYRNLRIKMAK